MGARESRHFCVMKLSDCNPRYCIAGLLKDDYAVLCQPLRSGMAVYSIVFFLLFPIGTPLYMIAAMLFKGMRPIVQKKMSKANFQALLALYMKQACSIEVQRMARLIGDGETDTEQFNIQCLHQFQNMIKLQGGGDCIVINKLEGFTGPSSSCPSPEGATANNLCQFFSKYDTDGDGIVDLEEFREMVRASKATTDLFTGYEKLDQLTDKQMEALVLYDGWPKVRDGVPVDIGESEGLGGLLKVVQRDIEQVKQTEVDDRNKEKAQRRERVAPGGDRSDASLQALDAIMAEIEGRRNEADEDEGSFWKTAAQKAEQIYVEDPERMESFLREMQIKSLSSNEKLECVKKLASNMVRKGITSVPPLGWNSTFDRNTTSSQDDSPESLLVNRLGFIFLAYRVEFWWWESLVRTASPLSCTRAHAHGRCIA